MATPAMRSAAARSESVLLILLAGFGIFAWRADPAFVRAQVQLELAGHAYELALFSIPMTLVIISGGIDLSVGSIMALSAVVLGLAWEAGWNAGLAAAAALVVGIAAGLVNGAFIARLRVHPLIITLATLSAYRGLAEGISRGRPISGFPAGFAEIAYSGIGGIPVPGILLVFGAFAAGMVLRKMALGRALYAIGFNETACRYSGIRVDGIKLLVYAISGLTAAVAAILFVARRNTAKADIASGIELDVITAVVLGGTRIEGGRGTIHGTMLGVLLIHELREFISWRYNSDEVISIVVGALLLGSVILGRIVGGRR